MENTKNVMRYNVLGALMLTVAVIIIAISGSYAFFVNKIYKVNEGNNGVTITSGNLLMSFETSNEFSASSPNTLGGLIDVVADASDTDDFTLDATSLTVLKQKAKHTDFSIGIDSKSGIKNAKYSLSLQDISISDKFKNKYVKYALYEGDILKAKGSFANYTTGDKVLLSEVVASTSPTSYVLYVWLENDLGVNQADPSGIDLRDGSLSFKVGFEAKTVAET